MDVAAGVIISSVVVSSGHYHPTTHHEGRLKSLPQLQFRHTLTWRSTNVGWRLRTLGLSLYNDPELDSDAHF
jgi:hypothetical protein